MRRALFLALLLLPGLFLAGPPRARADGWEEMRDEFRKGVRSEDWKTRRDAFVYLSGHDRPEAVREILGVLEDEENAAVVLAGVEALTFQKSKGSQEALFEAVRKGKERVRLLVLNALAGLESKAVADLLLEVAQGKDEPAAAQAALALAKQKHPDAVPVLIKLLKDKSWQVRRAAAIALREYRPDEAVGPLADALAASKGRERNEIIGALLEITGERFGNDPAAWKKLARGTPPEEIHAKPELVPTVFGVPIYGQRVVVCLDNSLRMTDPHPFDAERLRELSEAPEGDPIPWFRVKTNGQFAVSHVKHLLQGLPKGAKFELIFFNETVHGLFGSLANVGTATRNAAFAALDDLVTDNGIDSFDALDAALDVAGRGDAKAWKSGPDEIVFVTVNMPNAGPVTEADVVAAALGLKARLRMVPIHTVGIHYHPYEMCRELAARTGGVYVDLTK